MIYLCLTPTVIEVTVPAIGERVTLNPGAKGKGRWKAGEETGSLHRDQGWCILPESDLRLHILRDIWTLGARLEKMNSRKLSLE